MLDLIYYLIALALASWLVLGGVFLAYPTVQRLKERKDELGWVIKIPVYLLLIVGVLADIIFNATWGTVIFREFPHEFLFTDRLKRHWRDGKRNPRAAPWVRRVNLIDPGHV